MNAIRLRTEYLKDPMGIDVQHPRLMWNCEGGVKQTAYEIVTESWDSGKVASTSMQAVYPMLLRSRERVVWRVRLWDENDQPGGWAEACFEMGLLQKSDWQAEWITGNYKIDPKKRYPVDCFCRTFAVEKPVKKARLYITACGLYEARLNGSKAGDFFMAPGYTDYRKRVQYQTYDVTAQLSEGENTLAVDLADGWYRGSCGAFGLKNQYGTETKLFAQLEIEYTDGRSERIVSDETWAWSNDGPVRFADNKDGETVDVRLVPTYSGRAKLTKHSVVPAASNNVSAIEHERFHPVLTKSPAGKTILDFGQNIQGILSFRLPAHEGQRMVWRFGEMLDRDGEFTQVNIQTVKKGKRSPLQRIEYICAEGVNEYKTRFAVFGFRYAEVETDVDLKSEDIEAVAVYSDLEQTGFFSSSHPLLNQFVNATVWSAKGNHLDIPTDCPTRERHGWTGDAQIFFETAGILFDFAAFSRKYLHDVYDWQKKDGKLPHIAPDGGADAIMRTMNGSVGWSDVGILMPYRYWKLFGDESILREYYDGMAKYARFMEGRCGKSVPLISERIKLSKKNARYLVNVGQSYGEWAEPADVCAFRWQDFTAPHPEVSTAYTAYVLSLMAEIAEHLGKTEDAKEFRATSEGCKRAYQELVFGGKYTLDTDRQAQLVRSLAFGLLNDEQTEFAKKRLLEALEHYGWRLGTGFLSTPLILDVLTDIDLEAAYRLLENEEIPGWLSMPKNGATTVWENWEGDHCDNPASLNHYSKGAVCEWLFKTMCGIRVAGENRFVIAPRPGGSFTHAEAGYNSVYGLVKSGWARENGKTVYSVTIPANCTAELHLPDGTNETLAAGSYTFEA
ncbi:MAG: family 78 glycoside hydrolase catalytic domain [Oscillospiraceae bacterium]|nr:family 78 glycoside hydrolase catalytic domain [Oscillospiraceae bacterium]